MDLWVIDTSSIVEIRRGLVPSTSIPNVYRALGRLVDANSLVYPKQVLGELEEYTGFVKNKPDLPYEWAKKHEGQATRFGFDDKNLSKVLSHSIVRRVVDPDKSGREEADPYVLELATRLRDSGHHVTVITEDRKNKPTKLSLDSACGLLRIVSLPIQVVLESESIWTGK
jgi:hypothetical protein